MVGQGEGSFPNNKTIGTLAEAKAIYGRVLSKLAVAHIGHPPPTHPVAVDVDGRLADVGPARGETARSIIQAQNPPLSEGKENALVGYFDALRQIRFCLSSSLETGRAGHQYDVLRNE